MELVYLWVEDYKNIHKQGFNFSPRFECSYNENKNELTIDKKKDYLNIFPDNINVTALVGENGSGKSNLIDLILDLDGWSKTNYNFFFITLNNKEKTLYRLSSINKINCTPELKQKVINRNDRTNNSAALKDIGLNFSFLSLSPFLPKLDSYYTNNVKLYNIFNYRDKYQSKAFHYNSFMQSILVDIPELVENKFVYNFFNFNSKPKYLIVKYNKYIETIFESDIQNIIKNSSVKIETDKSCSRQIDLHNNIYISIVELNKKLEEKKKALKEELGKLNSSKKKKRIININQTDFIEKANLAHDLKKNKQDLEKKAINEQLEQLGTIEFFLSFENSSKDAFYFSTGEFVMLYYIRALLELNKEKNNSILVIDECELFLHPRWQKKFILFLTNLLENNNYSQQLIISSHSPFILSDLPKENVIFLENGKQKDVDLNPFGANIHTLLSHGFFMPDGLMGEFAKEKIKEIKRFYELVKHLEKRIQKNKKTKKLVFQSFQKRKNRFEKIHQIIGEPFLQTIIGNYLNEIYLLLSSDKTLINKELEKLEKRKKYLESLQK
jgi:predicted ATP-dependent endonuclease of OLD family